ncbi:MAG TPA: heavy metal resistance protein CzcC [Janthinobacterium sp.]|nr:heavy metal resistance protein CzcC [Janthinobacterium sp.]
MPSPLFTRAVPPRLARPLLRTALCAALAFSSTATTVAAPAATPPLSLAEAQRLALARSPRLPGQDGAITAWRQMAAAAGQLPDPVLAFGVDNLPISGADRFSLGNDFMTMRRVGLTQEFTAADKRRLRAERLERTADKSRAEKEQMVAAIERDTALAWFERYYALGKVALVAELAAQTGLELRAAEGAYRAGRGSSADVLAARAALGDVEDRTSALEQRARGATIALTRWIGPAAGQALADKPDTETLRLGVDDADLAHHPLIAALSRQEDIAASEVKLARAERSADWSVQVAFQQRGPGYANMLSVGLSIPLQWGHRQEHELAAKVALAEQAGAERDDALRAHVAEIAVLGEEWRGKRERRARFERELIPLARERTTALLAAYRGGKASLADVLAARVQETEQRLRALQLDADTARLWAQLNFLLPSAAPNSFQKDAK